MTVRPIQQAPVFRMDLELNGVKIELANMAPNSRVDFRLGKDSFGELLIFTKSNGKVYRIVDCKPA